MYPSAQWTVSSSTLCCGVQCAQIPRRVTGLLSVVSSNMTATKGAFLTFSFMLSGRNARTGADPVILNFNDVPLTTVDGAR